MIRFFLLVFGLLMSLANSPPVSAGGKSAKSLSAEQIVDRNVAARGGLEAWRAVTSLALMGALYTNKQENAVLPMVVKLKRPNKSRLEMDVKGQHLLQAFDGKNGWKVRRFHGQDTVAPYGPDDLASARAWENFDAPLIDYKSKDIRLELDGTEAIDGKPAYRLKLLRPDHSEQHVWVDAKSFLDVKSDDSLRRADGKMFRVATFYRDYRTVNGVRIPSTLEVAVDGVEGARKMVFKEIVVNPPLDDTVFTKPPAPRQLGALR